MQWSGNAAFISGTSVSPFCPLGQFIICGWLCS
uniref:Uncharacterized protein n=1 Tax=Anguilla anguilla TaxID=7936 RepID=A0A0E9U8T7_ANGAN